ncbi:LPXTG cell wall anchor domain-containing protein [Solobacterium moorei]
MTNTKNPVPPTTPKTGDNSNLSLYIGVAVVALAILGFVIVKRFKSSK